MTDLAAAATVADALRSPTARDAALDALEALPRPIADDVALAAAPALVDVVAGGLWRFPLGVAETATNRGQRDMGVGVGRSGRQTVAPEGWWRRSRRFWPHFGRRQAVFSLILPESGEASVLRL